MMIRQISIFAAIWTLTISGLLAAYGATQQAISCLLGGLFAGLNLVVLIWCLKKIFQKKSVALAGSVIVIKYLAIIGVFIAAQAKGLQLNFGFALGVAAMFPCIGYLAYTNLKQET